MPRTLLEKITDREHTLTAAAEQVRTQIAELTTHLADIDTELADLATTRRTILALGEDEPPPTTRPGLPDNPVYQHILTILTEADQPLRCKDLCHALDTGTEPARIEGMRSKMKRLVTTGLVTEDTPGLFTIPRPRTDV